MRYCLNREYLFEKDKGIYVGAIHEEYIPDQTEITDDQSEKPIENIDPWERTIFAIDFTHKKLLIQQRDYSPRNLSRPKTRTRITSILDEAWSEVFNMEFNFIPTNLNLGNDYFIDNFVKGRKVLGAKFSFNKSWLVKDIFDGDVMQEEWKDGWNHDGSKISELNFKTKADGDLHSSPFFKLAISSSGVLIESITYYDSILDKAQTESRSQFDQIEVEEVTKRTEITVALNETCRSIEVNEKKLRDLRAISLE